jgi:hypothetical protein
LDDQHDQPPETERDGKEMGTLTYSFEPRQHRCALSWWPRGRRVGGCD